MCRETASGMVGACLRGLEDQGKHKIKLSIFTKTEHSCVLL